MASGQVIPGGSSWVQQGSLHRGNLSGSQNIHIVDGQGASGLVVQAGTSGLTQGVLQADPDTQPMYVVDGVQNLKSVMMAMLLTHNFYTLVIRSMDMAGAPKGNSSTGTVEVIILHINDNLSTLEKDQYENTAHAEVLRLKAFDKDLENTENWLADFTIVSGNNNIFSIETNPKTKGVILMLYKVHSSVHVHFVCFYLKGRIVQHALHSKSCSSAILKPHGSLWPGSFKVTLEIKDKQGMVCPDKQVLQLDHQRSTGIFCQVFIPRHWNPASGLFGIISGAPAAAVLPQLSVF
ncbi:hypothetical protein Z043_116052 [Scleropages formosus]|uniref:Cadherin domain-containing protein n=1 Tax=Scleropages formosus TaxID=113540 RepID=A0A0P7WPA1_SCLFO|nr:hypothetical protein Z043_116052 [Scleropages formosus]